MKALCEEPSPSRSHRQLPMVLRPVTMKQTPFTPGCDEYKAVSRRSFLRGSASTALALGTLPSWLPSVAYAHTHHSNRAVIVSIYLRGGADGLTLCAPYAEPRYYQLRP